MTRACHRGVSGSVFALLVFLAALLPVAPTYPEGGTWFPLASLIGGTPFEVQVQGTFAYIAAGAGLTVADISDPANPRQVAYCETAYSALDVALSGDYAYVADGRGLSVVSIADPNHPTLVGGLDYYPEYVSAVAVAGTHAYIVGSLGLHVINVSDPTHPVEVGSFTGLTVPTSVAVSADHAYVVDQSPALRVISVADPSLPVEVGFVPLPSYSYRLVISAGYAYVAGVAHGLRVVDVSSPQAPVEVGYCTTRSAYGLAVAGLYAYVGCSDAGIAVINIADPAKPTSVAGTDTPGLAHGIAVAGSHAYVADIYGGLRVIDLSNPAAPAEVGHLETWGWVEDVAGAGDYAYAVGFDRFEALDVSDPANPVPTGSYSSPDIHSVAVSSGYAYLACGYDGLKVIRLADPSDPVQVAQWDPGPQNFSWATDVAVSGNRGLVGGGYGVFAADISDPVHPIRSGYGLSWGVTGLTLDGRYAYYVWKSIGHRCFGIYDSTTGEQLALIDRVWEPTGVAVSRGYAYIAGGYQFGMWVFNVWNPANPVLVGYIPTGGCAYDVAVSGSYAYVADYNGGLRVVDVSVPSNPVEVAYWNTPGGADTVRVNNGRVYVVARGWGLMIFPEAGATITGQVRVKGSTTGVAGATVAAYRAGRPLGSATTDAGGSYRIEGLAAGDYWVTASQRNCTSQTQTGITLGLSQTVNLDFELDAVRASIMGVARARATSAVLPNATVTASVGGQPVGVATTDSTGMYLIETTTYSTQYVLSCAHDGYETQTKSPITVAAGQTTGVNFFLDVAARLKGQVRSAATRAALVGARVSVYNGASLVTYTLTQAPYGIYRFETAQLAAGTYKVIASLANYLPQEKWDVTVSGGATTYLNFNLTPGVTPAIRGQVVDSVTGAPLIGADVRVYENYDLVAWVNTTAPWGMYAVDTLPEGTYWAKASAPGYVEQRRNGIYVIPGLTAYANFFLQAQ